MRPIRTFFAFLTFLVLTAPLVAEIPNQIIRVNSTVQPHNFVRPWSKKSPSTRKGIGTILENNRILISAEMIADHSYLELEKPGTGEKSPARVLSVDYSANLALLTPEDPAFLADFTPMPLADNIKIGDVLSAWQLESTGTLLQTDALLTAVQVAPYPQGDISMLVFLLTSALQSRDASFTIPLIKEDHLAGIAMRYDSRTQNMIAIPIDVIKKFLSLASQPDYSGFARIGISFASTRDPQFRHFIQLNGEYDGIYITKIFKNLPADRAGIQKGDILLSLKGFQIDADGNYEDSQYDKLHIVNLLTVHCSPGETIEATILRQGETLKLPITLDSHSPADSVSPPYLIDTPPTFMIVGGMIFQELSQQYLKEWGANWASDADQKLVYYDRYQDELFPDNDRKVVFLSQLIPTPATIGYPPMSQLVVTKVNNQTVHSLQDLHKALQSPVNGFHQFEFEDDPKILFLDPQEVESTNKALQEVYGVPLLKRLTPDASAPSTPPTAIE